MIKTLAIETSCDDTSIGIITFDGQYFGVEKLLAYSQVDDHQRFGGVVPEVASRLHSEQIIKVLESVGLNTMGDIDFISVTTHPGLPGSLVVGKTVASMLGAWYNKPVVEVNHIQGHIFSLLLERRIDEVQFPMMVLTASGGHNDIYLVEKREHQKDLANIEDNLDGLPRSARNDNIGQIPFSITKLGQTLDDAAGECFDKVSRMLGGPYPGGVWIGEKAEQWKKQLDCGSLGHKDPDGLPRSARNDNMEHPEIHFKRIFLSKDAYDFSFSGMKSQVSILLKNLEQQQIPLTEDLICCIAYEFQEAVVEVLAKKLLRAGIAYKANTLGIAGGVSCNERLRDYLNELVLQKTGKILQTPLVLRPIKKVYSTDNAAMIGVIGLLKYTQHH